MATERKKESSAAGEGIGNAASLGLIDHIKQLVESDRSQDKEFITFDELFFRLKRWWCKYYKRPYKDPLLEAYTFEELFYEYWDVTYVPSNSEADPQSEKEIPQSEYDWAAEEEAKELEELEKKRASSTEPEDDIIVDENPSDDAEWAKKYITDDVSLINPSPDSVDEGGDISASFED